MAKTTPSPARFDWTLVKSFLAVLDAGSLSAAARALGMHQPTLSRHVAELEAQLAVPLFERTGRGVAPTAAAQALVDAARQMQQAAEALERGAAGRRDQTSGTVRLTTSDVAAHYLLPPLLVELQAAQPGLQIELVASNQIDNLLRREADIAVRMVRPAQASLVARKLGDIGVGVYAHERYLARAGTPRQPGDLLAHRLVGFDRDDAILRGFAASRLPIARAQFALRTDDQRAYGCLVAEGAGIGFLAHYVAAQLPGLRRVLPQLAVPTFPCWLAVHREIRASRLVRMAYDALAEGITRRLAEFAA